MFALLAKCRTFITLAPPCLLPFCKSTWNLLSQSGAIYQAQHLSASPAMALNGIELSSYWFSSDSPFFIAPVPGSVCDACCNFGNFNAIKSSLAPKKLQMMCEGWKCWEYCSYLCNLWQLLEQPQLQDSCNTHSLPLPPQQAPPPAGQTTTTTITIQECSGIFN